VYGVALATLAIGWLVAARFARGPSVRSAAVLGAAAGLAVGGHLANVAFVAAALVLVVALSPLDRVRSASAFAIAVIATAGLVFVITAGCATGWSLGGMRHWLLHPGIGGSTDRSSLVGWGIGGLYSAVASGQPHVSWLPFGFDAANGHLEILVTWLLIAVAVFRGLLLAARSRTGTILATALITNTTLAFVLASWYQALRSDYWGLGLVPLAVMAGAGTITFRRRVPATRALTAAAALAVVAALLAWNAAQEVAPSIELSRARGRAVRALEARVPRDSSLLLSLILGGRFADDGYDAGGGFAALQAAVRAGVPKPGLDAVLAAARTRPVYVSSLAFGFTKGQARFLGATGRNIWKQLHTCCELSLVYRTRGLPRDESIYRVRPR